IEVYDRVLRCFSRIGRHSQTRKIGERTPPKNRVISVGSKFVISSRDVIPVVLLDRPLKTEAGIVVTKPIALSVVIWQRKTIEVDDRVLRCFSRIGRHSQTRKIGERTPPKNRVISVGSKFVISSRDVIPVVLLDRPLKTEAGIVVTKPIALSVVIWQRKTIER